MKELFKVLKDHKNPFMEELVSSYYQYCFRDEFESFVEDKDIGHVIPRAFSSYDPTRKPEPKYFKEILKTASQKLKLRNFCEDFLRLLNHNQKRRKDNVPCLIGAANSGKTSLFQPIVGLVHHGYMATIAKQRVFNKAMINHFTEVIFVDEANPSKLDIDDWKILTQGGYTACDVKYQTAKSFINRCPMLLTAQKKLDFGPEDQAAMDRKLKNCVFKSLPNPRKKAAEWLGKHSMDCIVLASTKTRPTTDQEEISESSLGEEQIGDGVLKDEEKEALRTLPLADVWTVLTPSRRQARQQAQQLTLALTIQSTRMTTSAFVN